MDHVPKKNRRIVLVSLFIILGGIIVITGWTFSIPSFKSFVPGFVEMKFNAALGFILFGLALLLTQYQTPAYNTLLFLIFSISGTLIGLITFSQELFHFNTGLDQLFITDKTAPSAAYPFPGRMAFNASLNFFLLGLGFLCFLPAKPLTKIIAQCLLNVVTVLSTVALMGYLYGSSLFRTLFFVTAMAPHTAMLFFILSIGASLLNPSFGITQLFTGKQVGNQMARRLFTLIILMVVVFGVVGQTHGEAFSSIDIGMSLLAICFLLVSLALIWNTANWLNNIDTRRSEAEGKVKLMNADLEKRVQQRTAEFQKSEEKYHSLIEQASDAIYVLDFDGHFTDVNASMCKVMGYSREELLSMKIADIIDPEELKVSPLPPTLNTRGQIIIRERSFRRKNGEVFTVEINVKTFLDDRVMVIARDITDRKKMETELREAVLKFGTLADKSMVGIYVIQHGKFVYVNPRFADVFGYTPEELINTLPVQAVIHESYHAITTENIRRRMEGEVESVHSEAMGKKKDGSTNWVEFYGNKTIMGKDATIIGSMIDISERKEAEDHILKEKLLSDSIINSLPGIFYLYNDDHRFLRWNINFEMVTGYTTEEIDEIKATAIIAEEDREKMQEAIQKAFIDGYTTVEANTITKSGTKIPFLFTCTPIMYEGQRCLLGTGINISKRIKSEEELRSSQQKYKHLFESNPMPLWMVARDDLSIIAVNEAAASHYGYTRNELLHMNAKELRLKEEAEQQREAYNRDADNTPLIVRHVKKDGTTMFMQVNAHDIVFEGRAVRLSLTNDITEKLKAEESLKKSEANLQTILRTTDTAYALFDLDLKTLAFNQKAIEFVEEHYQHTPKKGDEINDFFPHDRFPQFEELTKEALHGNNISYEADYPLKNGKICWYYVRLSPITNDKKETLGVMMALYDITERKDAEQDLKTAYERIHSHINSIKDMAWKQSHLIRSPLANLKALAAMLKDDPSNTEALNHISNELNRMDTIIIEMAKEAEGHGISD